VAVAAVFEFGKDALDAYDQMVDRHEELRNQPHRRLHVWSARAAAWNVSPHRRRAGRSQPRSVAGHH
jgi:hypothetical protein